MCQRSNDDRGPEQAPGRQSDTERTGQFHPGSHGFEEAGRYQYEQDADARGQEPRRGQGQQRPDPGVPGSYRAPQNPWRGYAGPPGRPSGYARPERYRDETYGFESGRGYGGGVDELVYGYGGGPGYGPHRPYGYAQGPYDTYPPLGPPPGWQQVHHYPHYPYIHSSELFGREPFTYGNAPRYFGTGTPAWGGVGFTGGAYGYGAPPPEVPRLQEQEAEYFDRGYYGSWGTGEIGRYGGSSRPSGTSRSFRPGPKGYQRSDERLREDISERLMQAYHIDSSEVTVDVRGGKVLLEGTVPDRRMKHAIEDMVDACPCVQDIDNRIRVESGPSFDKGSRQQRELPLPEPSPSASENRKP
jgi:hypothetical protein